MQMRNCQQTQLKNKALIISGSQPWINSIKTLFIHQGWLAESMSAHSITGQGSTSAVDFNRVIFVIDSNFCKCFSGLVIEMSAIVKNISAHTPVYLLFEHDDDHAFSAWQHHVKKTYKSVMAQNNMYEAIQNIIRNES